MPSERCLLNFPIQAIKAMGFNQSMAALTSSCQNVTLLSTDLP